MNSRPTKGIAVDAAHSSKRLITEFRGVDIETGEELFYRNLGSQTINIGEFLGVVAAIKYVIEHDYKPRAIYTDSMTALTWAANKSTSSNKRNKELQKAEIFLKVMACEIDTISISHWDNRKWGETPADFGRK